MKRTKHNYILISVFLMIVCTGICLPSIVLRYTFQSNLNQTKSVSKDYYNYSNSVISKNASSRLSEYEKAKLISGVWESHQIPVDSSYSAITQTQAAEYARNAVAELYEATLFPYHFDSSYGNWYSWEANLFQGTDTTFNTYSAYYWVVTFYKYDSEEVHDVLLTENGTLLSIRTQADILDSILLNRSIDVKQSQALAAGLSSWHSYVKQYYKPKYEPVAVSFLPMMGASGLPMYQQNKIENPVIDYASVMIIKNSTILTWTDFNHLVSGTIPDDTEIYYVYQCHNNKQSLFTLIPWE